MAIDGKPENGRRARKARETRQRIAEAALVLFLKDGFDETTLDAIAEAADISRRSFFHYYTSKEAILEAVDESIHDAFRAALTSAPRQRAPILAVRNALQQIIGRYSDEEAIAMDRLMHSTETLRVRKQANYVKQEKALCTALCDLWPDPARRSGLELVAMIGIGAMRLATDRWRADPPGRPLASELDRAFRELQSELEADGQSRRK